MSQHRETLGARLGFGGDPLDDPLNHTWDAIARNELPTSADANAADIALLRRFHTLDTADSPAPAFFTDLEAQLVSLYPASIASSVHVASVVSPRAIVTQPPPVRTRLFTNTPRWFQMWGALAVLGLLLIVGLLVLYRAVPRTSEPPAIPAAVIAKPSMQPLAQFDFSPPMWDMPDATTWDQMQIGLFDVAPETSFSTDVPWYTSVDGPISLTVLSGGLTIVPVGPALFYPANPSGQPPIELEPGESVFIGENDTIIYAATDGATGRNPGTVPARTLYGTVGPVNNAVLKTVPNDVSFNTYETAGPIASLPDNGATVTLQRLELAPFDSFVFEPDSDLRYVPFFDPTQTRELRMVDGAIDGLVPESGAKRILDPFQLRYLTPGPHTLFNLSDRTAEIYFLVVEPTPMPGTPVS